MDITLSELTTVESCDQTITLLEAEKTQLERKKRNLTESLEDKTKRVEETGQALLSSQALLAGYQAALAALPEGREKRNMAYKIEQVETKITSLENRQANYSAISLVEDQVNVQQLDVQIPVLTNAIAEIESHKGSL